MIRPLHLRESRKRPIADAFRQLPFSGLAIMEIFKGLMVNSVVFVNFGSFDVKIDSFPGF